MSPDKFVGSADDQDNYSGGLVAAHQADVDRRSHAVQISGGVAVAGVVLGILSTRLFFIIAAVAVTVFLVNAVHINRILDKGEHKGR